jgi:hypothetical protein
MDNTENLVQWGLSSNLKDLIKIMTVITDTKLINVKDVTTTTMTVAMFKQEPHDI